MILQFRDARPLALWLSRSTGKEMQETQEEKFLRVPVRVYLFFNMLRSFIHKGFQTGLDFRPPLIYQEFFYWVFSCGVTHWSTSLPEESMKLP